LAGRFDWRLDLDGFFVEVGVSAVDFVEISTGFILVMAVFFGAEKKYAWLNYFLLITFGLLCITFVLFHDGNVRFFAALMLFSTLIVDGVVTRKRKLEARET
jgi:hypothetical protein